MDEPVALGLVVFIVLRPWRDGLTFPSFNAYYAALVLIVAALWCARMLVRGESMRFPVPMALIGGFVGLAYLTGFATYSYDPTHRGLHHLAIYLLLFMLATNGLRNRFAVNIVLTGIVATWLANAVWTVFHYFVMMRGMRQVLIDNPQVMYHYFGTLELTPELKLRLESNRAFGTFLFPNALGAFLVLAIPFLATALAPAIRGFADIHRGWREGREASRGTHGYAAFAAGMAVTVMGLVALYFANDLLGMARLQGEPPIPGAYLPIIVFLVPAGLLGGGLGSLMYRRGATYTGQLLAAVGTPAAFLACVVALWLSYSRGATVALVGASALAVLLVAGHRLPVLKRQWRAAALVGFIALAGVAARPALAVDELDLETPQIRPTSIVHAHIRYREYKDELKQLDVRGIERRISQLGDLKSFRLRLSYWQVSVAMLADNVWTGVGLGNFQNAYPKYQFLGAGDVEAAHNDYLQYFTETGVFGGAAFLAFWVYFGVWGARRVLQQAPGKDRAFLVGIYAGTLAFAIHSLVDFNFQNPGLGSLGFVFAGLFFAMSAAYRGASDEHEVTAIRRTAPARGTALTITLLVLVTTGSVLRLFLFDFALTEGGLGERLYYVGDRKAFRHRMQAGIKLIQELNQGMQQGNLDPRNPPFISLQSATRLIPDVAELQTAGILRVPMPDDPTVMRRLRPSETIPPNAYLFITSPRRMYQLAVQFAEERIAELKKWDEMYPHDPELASHIFSWYDLLFSNAPDATARRRYAIEAEQWGRKAMERSPEVAWWRLNYAKALWMRGSVERGQAGIDYYYEGLEQYRMAKELYPVSPVVTSRYGQALVKLGNALAKSGRTDEGAPLRQEGRAMLREAELLNRWDELSA